MLRRGLMFTILLVALLVASLAYADVYVCPPCGGACDTLRADKAGNCQGCGMPLIRQSDIREVAVLVFNGVETLDFAGPYDALNAASGYFHVYTVAADTALIETSSGLLIRPARTFPQSPAPNILVIPGGGVGGVLSDSVTLTAILRMAEEAEITMSVCSGAFILARLKLLDGLTATCHRGDVEELRRVATRTIVVSDKRYVDNGRISTAAGVSSGIDATLHVISRLHTDERAKSVEEYLGERARDPVCRVLDALKLSSPLPRTLDVHAASSGRIGNEKARPNRVHDGSSNLM